MNIVIPMAGSGTRFAEHGYDVPKPFITINNKCMIEHVVDSLSALNSHKLIFICRVEHLNNDRIKLLTSLGPNVNIVTVNHKTDGAINTTLLAQDLINTDEDLLIVNSDQIVVVDIEKVVADWQYNYDGGILLFKSNEPKWSYAKCDDTMRVTEVAEKRVISEFATCGIYWFQCGSSYVKYANDMIKENDRTNGEFYICPIYNRFIRDSLYIQGSIVDEMHGLGTPEDLEKYIITK
jgi:NDP-sugar pyrophosphorylase family protein